jgi:hypothetical protein
LVHARILATQPGGGEPSKESQVLLNNLWTSVHGEEKPRPVVKGEKVAPQIPTFSGLLKGEKNKFLEAARDRVTQLTSQGGGNLLASLNDGGKKKKKDSGLLGTLKSAGKAAKNAGDLKANLLQAKNDLTSLTQWNDFVSSYYENWKKERAAYLANLVAYKAGLVNIEIDDRFKIKKKMGGSTKPLDKDIHVISASLDVPVRDQAQRGTCASFTGSRVMEILLKQNGVEADLSEQYFYWSSKPKCQMSKCKEGGSWFFEGYEYSVKSPSPNIPLEKDCPYNPKPVNGNDTQIPLQDGCTRGFARSKTPTIRWWKR